MKRRKFFSLFLALCLFTSSLALADGGTPGTPPGGQPPQGETNQGTPPDGNPPEKPDGNPPDGNPPQGGPGGPGGQSGQPESYTAVQMVSEDVHLSGLTLASTGTDENALLVTAGNAEVSDSQLSRVSSNSSGGDNASFYGVGAAALVTGGKLTLSGSSITTDASGGAGVFAYGDGVISVSDTIISTVQDTSGGIHVAGGGTLYASNLTVTTQGNSAAAIRSDRGGGTMEVDGGSYTSNGSGSPAVYVTADIRISNAALTATGSEALCLEGLNSVSLTDCDLTGNMPDLSQNDNTWTVILYQSMSGDSEVGKGSFVMEGGSLTSANGGLFYTTNTESEFTLRGVRLNAAADSEYLLRCTGNQNQRGWGQSGRNGADCTFTAAQQEMSGAVVWDSISTLRLNLTEASVWTGSLVQDESCAGDGGDGSCSLTIDATSTWIVTGDSVLTNLSNAGTIRDENGLSVSILDQNGSVLVSGDSAYTITVESLTAA